MKYFHPLLFYRFHLGTVQIGQQDIALGVKFKAKAVVEVEELSIKIDGELEERNILFQMTEGDFSVFKGLWSMSDVVCCST